MKRLLVVLLLAGLVTASCTRETVVTGTAPAATVDDTKPQDGGTLYRRLEVDASTLNPILSSSKYDRVVANCLFTPLVYIDAQLKAIPGLADSWDISKDGLTFTFKLNPKATFTDGTPVKASDVVFTLAKITDPKSESVQIGSNFVEIDMAKTKATDDHTVVVAMKHPVGAQLVRFNDLIVLPEHVYGQGDFSKDHNDTAVGSGPYRLVRRSAGKETVVERRPDYWGKRPYIQTIVFKVIGDHGTAYNAVKRGEIDETLTSSDTWLRERTNPQNARTLNFLRFYTLTYNFITWNQKNPLFRDKRVRQALAMCIDRASLINGIYGGTARALSGPFTPEQWAYNPTVPVTPFDPVAAKQQLASAGWLDTNGDGILDHAGKPLKFELIINAGSSQSMSFAQMYQNDLKKIGVDMSISVMEGASSFQRILNGSYDAAYLGLDLDPDPDPYQLLYTSQTWPKGQNLAFYSNPTVDQMLDAGRREVNQSKRADIYRSLHTLLADEQPYTWVMQVSSKWVFRKRVHGVVASPLYGLDLWYPGQFDWWIAANER